MYHERVVVQVLVSGVERSALEHGECGVLVRPRGAEVDVPELLEASGKRQARFVRRSGLHILRAPDNLPPTLLYVFPLVFSGQPFGQRVVQPRRQQVH